MPKSNLAQDRAHKKTLLLSGNIRKYMTLKSRTAWDMARALGIVPDTWYKKMRNPESFKFEEVIRIVHYLDFSPADREELL